MPWECNTWRVLIALVCRLAHMAPQEYLLSNGRPDLLVTGCPDSKEELSGGDREGLGQLS